MAHSFTLSGQLPTDLLATFPALMGLSMLGVNLFFIISGYLIAQSWEQNPFVIPFVLKRVLRIFPGLSVCLALSIAFGAIFTTLSFDAYWASDKLPEYFWRNLALQNYLPLPGVFDTNPAAGAVNGSLWTISVEVTCYLAILLMGFIGVFKHRWTANAGLCVALILAITQGDKLNLFGAALLAYAVPGYLAAFLFGAFNFINRHKLMQSFPLACALMVMPWLAPQNGVTQLINIALLSYFTINTARILGKYWPERAGATDLSFGIYIYAFPIQQALVQYFPKANGWAIIAMTLPVCILFAACSWFCVERPALNLKRLLIRRPLVRVVDR